MLKFRYGTHLFGKVTRPGDSEGTFSVCEWSCYLLLPVLPLKGRANFVMCLIQGYNKLTCRPIFTLSLLCWTSSRKAVKSNFKSILVW